MIHVATQVIMVAQVLMIHHAKVGGDLKDHTKRCNKGICWSEEQNGT
jgi:hypothetical protein